jgi:hypothetical protein
LIFSLKIWRTAHSEKKGPIIGRYSVLSKLLFSDKNTKYKKYTITVKRVKNVFQPADPIILPETPQIPALCGVHLGDGLNLISQ